MKNSAFLCDFIRERESQLSDVGLQPVTARPAPVIDRANTGGSYSTPRPVIDRKNPGNGGQKILTPTGPGPYIDRANLEKTPRPAIDHTSRGDDNETMQTTTAATNSGQSQSMGVISRNMWILVGAGLFSITLIFWMFNRNE
jgi:hypothetical protein